MSSEESIDSCLAILTVPPSHAVLGLAYTETAIASLVLFTAAAIVWGHGRAGMMCWPIFLLAPIAVLVADVYLIFNQDKPLMEIPDAVWVTTEAIVMACVSLTLVGVVYEWYVISGPSSSSSTNLFLLDPITHARDFFNHDSNTILPSPSKAQKQKALLGLAHLVNMLGIVMGAYGGTPDGTGEAGVRNKALNRAGNLLMLFVLLLVCGCMWPTLRTIRHHESMAHPNAEPARRLFWAGLVAMLFWIVRIGYNCVYAFVPKTELDPVVGSFAVKLVLLFGMWMGASVALCVGGWRGVPMVKLGSSVGSSGSDRDDNVRVVTDVEIFAKKL